MCIAPLFKDRFCYALWVVAQGRFTKESIGVDAFSTRLRNIALGRILATRS